MGGEGGGAGFCVSRAKRSDSRLWSMLFLVKIVFRGNR